jgi:hypothetical protein
MYVFNSYQLIKMGIKKFKKFENLKISKSKQVKNTDIIISIVVRYSVLDIDIFSKEYKDFLKKHLKNSKN